MRGVESHDTICTPALIDALENIVRRPEPQCNSWHHIITASLGTETCVVALNIILRRYEYFELLR